VAQLGKEDIDAVGRDFKRMDEGQLALMDYDCTPESIFRAAERVNREGGWKHLAFVSNILNNCDVMELGAAAVVAETPKPLAQQQAKAAQPRKKKAMSGYNCYMKACATKKPFKQCLSEKGWKPLSDVDKGRWNDLAKDGCEL